MLKFSMIGIHLQVILNRGYSFLKRFNSAGVHNFTHMWWPQRPLQGVLAEWWSPTTFTSCRPIPWATPKGLSPPLKDGYSSSGTVCCMARLVCQRNPPQATSAVSLYVCTSLQTFYTLLRMPNGKPELGSSWISLSKLVSRLESHTSTRGCTLMLNHKIRTRVLGQQERIKQPHPNVAAHPILLACLNT
jgi:hypothetical protein